MTVAYCTIHLERSHQCSGDACDAVTGTKIECPNCGHTEEFLYGQNVPDTCSKCGTEKVNTYAATCGRTLLEIDQQEDG